ncbi:BrxA family protein [Psychrobacter sp. BF1]|uniref:BrxA family protein n=1 Tax=Psychrobacter sp. BF1 TaxID=2821147 RepID=UPI00211A12B9|nr:BrxA family protein [Psychrobacter sp. BF1]
MIGGSLLLTKTRVIAEALLKKLPEDELKALIVEHNILQKKSDKTSSRYASAIRKRIEGLGDEFMQWLWSATDIAYIQLLLIAVITAYLPKVSDCCFPCQR